MLVSEGRFDLIEEAFRAGGPAAVFDLLLRRAREDKDARGLFDARILQVRHQLGLPLIQTEPVLDLTPEQRPPRSPARSSRSISICAWPPETYLAPGHTSTPSESPHRWLQQSKNSRTAKTFLASSRSPSRRV